MGQIWAAIKSLGIIAELVREVFAWWKERQRKKELDEADQRHDQNAAAIDDAFAVGMRVDGAEGEPRRKALEPAGLSGGEAGGAGLGEGRAADGERPAKGE